MLTKQLFKGDKTRSVNLPELYLRSSVRLSVAYSYFQVLPKASWTIQKSSSISIQIMCAGPPKGASKYIYFSGLMKKLNCSSDYPVLMAWPSQKRIYPSEPALISLFFTSLTNYIYPLWQGVFASIETTDLIRFPSHKSSFPYSEELITLLS